MEPIRITVEGVGVKLSSNEDIRTWLEGRGVRSLLDSDGDEVGGIDTLRQRGGGQYTLGPPRHEQRQQQQPRQEQPQQPPQIEFETTTFDDIDPAIVTSKDETGTVQTGWRRERDNFFPTKIYLRQHLNEFKSKLDEFMNHPRHRQMYISGPPGSGKTTYGLFYFTRHILANDDSRKALIVQYRDQGNNEIMILEGKQIRRVSRELGIETAKVVAEVIKSEGKATFSFVVFDGMRQNNQECNYISKQIRSSVAATRTKVIQITPLAFVIRGGDSLGGIHGIVAYFKASSWKLEDYEKAIMANLMDLDELQELLCLDIDFEPDDEDVGMEDSQEQSEGDTKMVEDVEMDGSQEKAEEETSTKEVTLEWLKTLAKRKYFYAGGSARFMFEFSVPELIHGKDSVFYNLEHQMSTEEWEKFAQLQITKSTTSSVSTGMQYIDEQYVPVSEYFLRLAHTKIKSKLTASVRAAANSSRNPALRGWAFELEQLDIIEEVVKLDPAVLSSEDHALVVPLHSAKQTTYDGESIGKVEGDAFTIWCSKWNQGCFDVAFFIKSSLITINFTVSNSHSLKINPLRDLKEALEKAEKKVDNLFHIAVIEKEDTCASFRFDEPEGAGKEADENLIFSIRTSRSPKLTAKSDPQVNMDQDAKYGKLLSTIRVFPREWTFLRKRKKPDYYSPTM